MGTCLGFLGKSGDLCGNLAKGPVAVLVGIVWPKMSWLLSTKKGPALFSLPWAPLSLGWAMSVAAELLQHREFNSKSMKGNTTELTKMSLEQFFITNSVCRNMFFLIVPGMSEIYGFSFSLGFLIAEYISEKSTKIYNPNGYFCYLEWDLFDFFILYFTLYSFMVMTGMFSAFCHFVISLNQV